MKATLAFWLGLLAAGGVKNSSQPPAREQPRLQGPVDIRSDRLVVEQDKSRAVFSGQVVVRQDKLEIKCENLVVEYGNNAEGKPAIQRMLFGGGVVIELEQRRGGCQNAEYRQAERSVICSGEAWVIEGGNRITGELIEYRLESGQIAVQKPRVWLELEPAPEGRGRDSHGARPR